MYLRGRNICRWARAVMGRAEQGRRPPSCTVKARASVARSGADADRAASSPRSVDAEQDGSLRLAGRSSTPTPAGGSLPRRPVARRAHAGTLWRRFALCRVHNPAGAARPGRPGTKPRGARNIVLRRPRTTGIGGVSHAPVFPGPLQRAGPGRLHQLQQQQPEPAAQHGGGARQVRSGPTRRGGGVRRGAPSPYLPTILLP